MSKKLEYKKLIISIGANIRNPSGFHPMDTCEKAINEINNYPIKVLKRSNWYISDPIPRSKQPKYYNCLINGITELNDISVLNGGPVEMDKGFIIHNSELQLTGSTKIEGINCSLNTTKESLALLCDKEDEIKANLYLG